MSKFILYKLGAELNLGAERYGAEHTVCYIHHPELNVKAYDSLSQIRVRRNNDGNPIEELYHFHFQTQITDHIGHVEPYNTFCKSNDLLVTVHANQDKRAAGRILWTNMSYEEVSKILNPYQNPNLKHKSVDHDQFKNMLNRYLLYEMVQKLRNSQ